MTQPKHDYLKTKVTSLRAEVKLILQFERARYRKASKFERLGKTRSAAYNLDTANGLREHRLNVVQTEARWANIAYGMLRGHEYKAIERDAYNEPDWERIEKLVLSFGERDNPRYNQTLEYRFKDWVDRAREYWKSLSWARSEEAKVLDVDSIGNNQIGYMEPNSEYMLNTRKAKRRADYVPRKVCADSAQGI